MLESKKAYKQRLWEDKRAQQETPEARAAREKAQSEGAAGARRKAQQESASASSKAREAAGNPKKSAFIHPSQFATIGAKLGGGGAGFALLHHRKAKEAKGQKVWGGKKGDAALGAASSTLTGWGGLDVAGWSMKRGSDAYRMHKEHDPNVKARSDAAWNAYRKKMGFKKMGVFSEGDTLNTATNAGQRKAGFHYPKDVPGWSVKRAIALKNHPAFLAGATGVLAAAGATYGLKRHKEEPVKKDAFGVSKAISMKAAKVLSAYKPMGTSPKPTALGTKLKLKALKKK